MPLQLSLGQMSLLDQKSFFAIIKILKVYFKSFLYRCDSITTISIILSVISLILTIVTALMKSDYFLVFSYNNLAYFYFVAFPCLFYFEFAALNLICSYLIILENFSTTPNGGVLASLSAGTFVNRVRLYNKSNLSGFGVSTKVIAFFCTTSVIAFFAVTSALVGTLAFAISCIALRIAAAPLITTYIWIRLRI